ncbi:MAG: beta-propeller fold lactonase family protein, partial [Bryobacteraceae bacterium]
MQRLYLLYVPAMMLFALLPAATKSGAAEFFVYFGTYTRGASKGIYVSRLDTASGKLSEPVLVAETANPSFLAIHPNRKFLYAVSEGPAKGGGVSAFAIDPKTGGLTFLNKVGSEGNGPCHVTVDKTGKYVLVANYGSGSAAVLPIAPDGKLEPASSSVQHK